MQIINRLVIVVICGLFAVSCSTKAKFESYDKQLNEIRTDVRNIRLIADQMRNDVINMKTSVGIMNENVDKQAKEIDSAREHQKKLAEAIESIKTSVVKLESETLPAKQEELKELKELQKKEKSDNVVMVSKTVDGITIVESVKTPDVDGVETKKVKYTEAVNVNSGFGYAVKDGVILWHSPTKESEVVEVLLAWQQVTILGSVSNDGMKWLKIKTDDFSGYVNSKFIMVSDTNVSVIEAPVIKQKSVTVEKTDEYGCVTSDNGLKIRFEPKTESEAVGVVRYMSKVKLIKPTKDGVWYEIFYNEHRGFVYAKFIKPTKNGQCVE